MDQLQFQKKTKRLNVSFYSCNATLLWVGNLRRNKIPFFTTRVNFTNVFQTHDQLFVFHPFPSQDLLLFQLLAFQLLWMV